ncbi:hemicentin-2-like [Pungitius pungitius]|uniref:hemicentin-2-like n=1 Tax=Pungitius pungitius TaxID=134920 RepID=UPI002E1001AF
MANIPPKPSFRGLHCVFLVALMGASGLEAREQISWTGEVTAGFPTTFTCSSSCQPNCTYTWSFEGHTVQGSRLTWTPDGLDNTVELQCTVLHPETGASRSVTSIVEIKNRVSVQISQPTAVPSLNQPLDLVCRGGAAAGDPSPLVNQVIWYKDGRKLTLRENMQLLQNNLTLHFDSALAADAGFYLCETRAPRVFSLGYLLSFDPWNVSIGGPGAVFPGRLSKFTCLTSCALNVDCTVRWQFREGFPIGSFFSVHKNELRWTPSIPGTSQSFTCVAENAAAGRSSEATESVQVLGIPLSGSESVHPDGLSAMIVSLGFLLLFDAHSSLPF